MTKTDGEKNFRGFSAALQPMSKLQFLDLSLHKFCHIDVQKRFAKLLQVVVHEAQNMPKTLPRYTARIPQVCVTQPGL